MFRRPLPCFRQSDPPSGNEPALGGRGSSPASTPALGGKAAMLHALESLRDESWQVRRRAVEQLGKFGDDQVIVMLGETLTDSNELVRERAAQALGKIGGDKAYQTLVQAFESNDVQAQRTAIFGLSYYPNPYVIKRMIVLLGHPDWSLREHAADSLVIIGEAATPWLVEVLEKGLNATEDYQTDLARLLQELRSAYLTRFGRAHQSAYGNEDDTRARTVLRILGRIGGSLDDLTERNRYYALIAPYLRRNQFSFRALEALTDVAAPASLDLLTEFVRGEHTPQTMQAARALGRLGEIALPFMFYIVLSGVPSEVATIQYAFAELPPSALPSLIERALPLNRGERYRLAETLMPMNHQSRQVLYDFLQHDDRRTRYLAIDLIGIPTFTHEGHSTDGVGALSDVALQHYDMSTRRRAVQKLGEIWPYALGGPGHNSAKATLAELAASRDVTLKRAAIKALVLPPWPAVMPHWWHVLDDDTRELLLVALEDEDIVVRRHTIMALGSYEVVEIVPRLIEILESNERELHHAASQALGRMGRSNDIIQAMVRAAGPSYTNTTRLHAIRALSRLGAQSAVPMLLNALTDNSHQLRKEAANALRVTARFVGKADVDAMSALYNALSDSSNVVRCHAARALALAGDATGSNILREALNALTAISNLTREEIEEALERIT